LDAWTGGVARQLVAWALTILRAKLEGFGVVVEALSGMFKACKRVSQACNGVLKACKTPLKGSNRLSKDRAGVAGSVRTALTGFRGGFGRGCGVVAG